LISYIVGRNWLRVYENRVLRKISGPRREGVSGDWESCILRSFSDLY
jgi:hypothetical protein